MAQSDVDLYSPFERDVILEVRTSRMKPVPNSSFKTGIDKQICHGKVPVSFLGLEADEHDLTFHGGKDKAIHGYCSSHYPQWRREYPEAEERFKPGGFGENFVTERMNERNICIGDIMSVGGDGGLLIQVSLPRQPCFKLNVRFQLKNFAPVTSKSSRTGWYYRVLREGVVQAGDEIRLVERKWPKWTIERVQEYMFRTENIEANEELSKLPELGDDGKKAFGMRVAKAKAKQRRAVKETAQWRDYRLVEKKPQTSRVTSFVLEAVVPEHDAVGDDVKFGSHAKLRLPNGLLRSYSIVSGSENQFELGIALDEQSRGGSEYLHREAKEGDLIQVGPITSDIDVVMNGPSNHVFIAGGIGITAFLSMMQSYRRKDMGVTLHYGVRNLDDIPFRERIEGLKDSVKVYDRSQGQRMDIPTIFRELPFNPHVYVCGPQSMLDMAKQEAKRCRLGQDEVHYEAFSADASGDPFEVEVANEGGKVLKVEDEETLLEVLRRYFDVPSSCEVGNCATCKVGLKGGRVEHRGTALSEEDKKVAMLSCVSRGVGKIAIEV
ncbi:PK beta-barrel-protein domain-containing protein-like protein [Xylaria nigripes]|nr:PK beta-barrel-protein domain-containing protein-like protein [Xylaria nigripes]